MHVDFYKRPQKMKRLYRAQQGSIGLLEDGRIKVGYNFNEECDVDDGVCGFFTGVFRRQ